VSIKDRQQLAQLGQGPRPEEGVLGLGLAESGPQTGAGRD